jgi:hypothetical protein
MKSGGNTMKELDLKKLQNADDLAKMIELYKNDKITKFALEKELIGSYLKVTYPLKITFCISEDHTGPSGSTFGLIAIPKISPSGTIVEICIDKDAIKNAFTPEEMVKIIFIETLNIQKTIKTHSRFMLDNAGGPISLGQAVAMFLDTHKDTLEEIMEYAPEVLKNKPIPSIEKIEELIKLLEDPAQKSEEIVEKVVVEGILPKKSIEAAKELVKSFKENLRGEENTGKVSDPDNVSINTFKTHTRTFVDGTYQIPGKKIAHDYEPDTNQ